MKIAFAVLLLTSGMALQSVHADTTILSSDPLENAFVRISQVGGDASDPILHFSACEGTPDSAHDCKSIGKRDSYRVSELRHERKKLREEEVGFGILDVAVVAGSIGSGAIVGEALGTGVAVVLGTGAGTSTLAAVGIYSVSNISIIVDGTVAGALVAGSASVVADVKKLNPFIEKREADSLNKILSGSVPVPSMNVFITTLTSALDF